MIEASFNGGAFADIATSDGAGAFSGTLTNQTQGQGTLTVRLKSEPTSAATVSVGIGDVIILGGQSNAEGYGVANQSYSHASLKASKYTGSWAELIDPTDPDGAGSPWPLLATLFLADQSVPVAFVPCGVSGSGIATWQSGQANYNTLKAAALATGAKVVLWHQGESDAISGLSQVDYNDALDAVANQIQTDLGVQLMACKLEDMSTYQGGYDETAVNAAIAEAWGDNVNVLQGPDFSDITPSMDGLHFKTNTELQEAADRWWVALQTAFYL